MVNNKKKLIYLFGLSRSGSTFLSKQIVEHCGVVSLGEIIKNIEIYRDKKEFERYKRENRRCTCGEIPEKCDFWGDQVILFKKNDPISSYHNIIEKAEKYYENAVFMDTSKTNKRFKNFHIKNNNKNIDVICVNIIRHYAGQVESYQKYHSKWNKGGIMTSIFADAYYWLFKNYQNLKFIEQYKLPTITIYYEDLIFKKEVIINSIQKFIDFHFPSYKKYSSVMHEMGGNEGFKKRSKTNFYYDYNWMFSNKLNYFSVLLFPVMICNKHWHNKFKI